MEEKITQEDRNRIQTGIQGKYRKVAQSPAGLFKYPTGRAGLEALQYDLEILKALPDSVVASYCGVGNPFFLDSVNPGDTVLDIGCGAGVDTLIAALMAGPPGKAVGVDVVPEMLARAEENRRLTGIENAAFQQASGEKLPFEDNSFDVLISNGAINLIPDKAAVLKEAWRVLKPGGRLMIADQMLAGAPPRDPAVRIDKWAQ